MNLSIKEDIEYILGIRKCIIVATIIFLSSIALGVIMTENTVEGADISQHVIMNIPIKEHRSFEKLVIIFQSNLYNCVLAILLGIGLGIIPVYIAIYNGVLMGTVIGYTSNMPNGVVKFIISILPHGIIEIPIMLISIGIGLKMGYNMFSFLLHIGSKKLDKRRVLLQELEQSALICIKLIIPGLLIAAMIESYITPLIMEGISRYFRL